MNSRPPSDASAEAREVLESLLLEARVDEALREAEARNSLELLFDLLTRAARYAEASDLGVRLGRWAAAVELACLAGDESRTDALIAQIALDPERALEAATALQARGQYRPAACLFDAAGDSPRAAAAFERARATTDAARVLATLGRFDDAIDVLRRAMAHGASDLQAYETLAELLVSVGRTADALRILQRARADDAPHDRIDALIRQHAERVDARARARIRFVALELSERRLTATLWRGEDRSTGAPVRIEHLESWAGNEAALECISGTIDALRAIDHPHITRVLGWDRESRVLVLEGSSMGALADWPSRPGWTVADLANALADIADAFAAVHRRGLVHGAFDETRVVFDESGTAKLDGLELAGQWAVTPTLTSTHGRWRTLSPERRGGAPPDAASDVYALGIVFRSLAGLDAPGIEAGASGNWPREAIELSNAMVSEIPARRPAARAIASQLRAIDFGTARRRATPPSAHTTDSPERQSMRYSPDASPVDSWLDLRVETVTRPSDQADWAKIFAALDDEHLQRVLSADEQAIVMEALAPVDGPISDAERVGLRAAIASIHSRRHALGGLDQGALGRRASGAIALRVPTAPPTHATRRAIDRDLATLDDLTRLD